MKIAEMLKMADVHLEKAEKSCFNGTKECHTRLARAYMQRAELELYVQEYGRGEDAGT